MQESEYALYDAIKLSGSRLLGEVEILATKIFFGSDFIRGPAVAAFTGAINFATSANQKVVSDYTKNQLKKIMQDAGVRSLTITSTARTPSDQARIMHDNIEQYGVDKQKRLYGSYGRKVIDEYPDQEKMLAKINELGPSNVSKHIADPSVMNVVDIDPGSISNKTSFENSIMKKSMRVHRYFLPDVDPVYHLEFLQPK